MTALVAIVTVELVLHRAGAGPLQACGTFNPM